MEKHMNAVCIMERKRKTVTIRIDPLVWDAVEKAAKSRGISASRWLEMFAFDNLQHVGLIGNGEEYIGETRGGDRKSDEYKGVRDD